MAEGDDAAFPVAKVHHLEQQMRCLPLNRQKAELADDEHNGLGQMGYLGAPPGGPTWSFLHRGGVVLEGLFQAVRPSLVLVKPPHPIR
jgi:hypothetical protein